MKRTWELTSIYYRSAVKRRSTVAGPATPNPQNQDVQSPCPVCGTLLETVFANDPSSSLRGSGAKGKARIALRVAQQQSPEQPDPGPGS